LRHAGGDQAGKSALEKIFGLIRRRRVRASPPIAGRQPYRAGQRKLKEAGDADSQGEPGGDVELINVATREQSESQYHYQVEHHHTDNDGTNPAFGVKRRRDDGYQTRQNDVGRRQEQQKGCE
jgi:hypothetical protein